MTLANLKGLMTPNSIATSGSFSRQQKSFKVENLEVEQQMMQTKATSQESHPCSTNLDRYKQKSVNLSKVEVWSYEMMGF